MEMKSYQRRAVDDLSRYMELLNQAQDYAAAFSQFWQEKSAPALGHYQDILPGVPNLCFKVPTGGGKTFLACNALRPVFDALPMTKMKAVVWLVPSDAILSQTLKNLQDSSHPYRQAIDVAFGGRVTVYSKQELLSGQNFNITAVTEQLSIMVLSYDSFRGRSNEALKAYRENSSLAPMAKALGKPQQPIEKADDTALFQVINQLSPLVIVDESHHARSELSLDMLKDFNPCFVLELTATPKKNSNILSYVDAAQLKAANMVKLPVIVYNRDSQQEVITDAIDLRRNLERLAEAERSKSGKYIRPIVLFQAQPKGKENSTTFEKLRIPQFFQVVPQSLFHEGTLELLEKEQLASGFTLKGKAYDIDFGSADDELVQVDVRTKEGSVPKVFKMSDADQRYFKEYFNSKPAENRVRMCKDIMFRQLNKLDIVDAAELREYLERIVNDMDKPQLAAMEKSPLGYAAKIRNKIDTLLTQHYMDTFHQWIETEKVICSPHYQLPSVIHPANSTSFLGGSLYQAEADMNELEQDLVMELTALSNVRWWHRNISRQGFCINGFIHHYPDIMVMTESGKVILVETKGGHLKNDDSQDKIELGKAWQYAAGSMYRYYMVFRDEENLLHGAVSMKQFLEVIRQL